MLLSRLRTTFATALAALALPLFVSAQNATTTLVGRVTDGFTGLPLAGTRVVVAGSAEAFTNRFGEYTVTGVPEGSQPVAFSYVGYRGIEQRVAIQAGRANRLDVQFGGEEDTVNLDEFVIEGSLVGTARAINQQRAAATLANIVASDEIGRFPDQNAAEALQRIPGVSLYRDQGEGRYIVLRGLNFEYTSVRVNGGSFAGADLGERATALDVVPADALASIEVTKVPTPDMDGEGLGGQVNIKTKSAFDYDGRAAGLTAQAQYSELSDKFSSKFNGFYSTRFGEGDRWGLLLAPTWQVRDFGSHNVETGGAWVSPEDNGTPFYVAEALEFRDYVIERERYGITAALETRPDDATSLYLRGGYSRFTDTESRHLTIFDFTEGTLDEASVTATSATHDALRRYGRRLRVREKDQEVLSLVAGGERSVGGWKLDGQLGFTEGKERRPDELTARFRRNTRDAVVRYDITDTYRVDVAQLAGASFFEPSSYAFQRVDLANESGKETSFDAGMNARYDFGDARRSYVKTGLAFRAKEKESEGEVFELGSAPAGFSFASLADSAGSYPFLRVPRISTDAFTRAYYDNPSGFTGERVFEDSEFDDFEISEDVFAAYLMGGSTFGRLNVIGGLRIERTSFDTTGNELDLVDEIATPISASQDYTNVLPGIYLRYDANEKLVFRASWSSSLARPGFSYAAIRSNVNRDDLEITRGNPALDPLEATSFDASVEYYLSSLGVVSASVFHKQIDNFSYEFTADEPVLIGGEEYELTTFANGSDGSITGLELAYQQELRFLPAPFDGLGFMANVTFLDSEAKYPTRVGEDVPFIGQSDYTGNVGLTYDKGRFFARLAMNFRSERLREDEPIGGSMVEDLYVDDFAQLDLTMRYEFNRDLEFFAEFVNLTDEPFRVFLKSDNGQGARLGQWEEYGRSVNFGLRWKL